MTALAAVSLRDADAADLLVAYAEHVQGLTINPDAKRIAAAPLGSCSPGIRT